MHASARVLLVTIAIFALLGCQAQPRQAPATAAVPAPDYWPTSGWKTSTPEQQGMDSAKLAALFDAVEGQHLNLRSILIIRNGYIVAEAYYAPSTADVKQQLASVTKSVTGMLAGIAIDQGKIKDTGQSVVSYFPDRTIAHLDQNKRSMTLENLLTLTHGLDCGDEMATDAAMFRTTDWVQFALDMPMASAPGMRFHYCSAAVHILSPILQRATGKSERELANETLFPPLGIAAAEPGDWSSDPQGFSQGFAGLALAPRDMAKLGFLYLHGGQWNGQQVVPAAWVARTLSPLTTEQGTGRGYGYLVWLYPQGYRSMMGLGGQDIHLIPAKNMVVVFTAAVDNATHDKQMIKLLDDYVVPAATSGRPLAENPAALAQLQDRIARVTSPQPATVPALPSIARSASGKVYTMGANPRGWTTISFVFPDGSAEAVVTVNGTAKLAIGLDGIYRTSDYGAGPEAARGRWEDEAFVIDDYLLGTYNQWQVRVTFPGDQMLVSNRELVTGEQFNASGSLAR